MGIDPSLLGKAVAARLAEVEAAIERYGSFAFEPGQEAPPPALHPGEGPDAARELVLRALRAAGDPVNYQLLRRLAEGDAPLAELAGVVSLPRLSAWERVNDLVQAGLVARSLEGDRVGLTPMGQALAELVEEAVVAAGEGREP